MLKKISKGQRGVTLIEALVALAIVGLLAVALLSALATGGKATLIAKEQATAESLARSQIEYIKNSQTYQIYTAGPPATTYSIDSSIVPAGWSVPEAAVEPVAGRDDNIQKITVTVYHGAKSILSLSDYKANR